ncbi:TPA: hypothetical protein DDW35_13170 [Candidatus Sumerlaeota bacterium]|jgi:hypothetical protein|nr:hypothetical protein [Candidatus Sumerlaeota bacterium]
MELPNKPSLTRPLWWPYLLLIALVFIFFWDSFCLGRAPLMRDTFCDFMSWRIFGRQAFHAGVLPLWNPYSHAGQPYIANPQTAFFYPPHLLFYLLEPVFALKLWLTLHLVIAACSMYALARHWRLDIAPALLAAIAFAFGSHLIAGMEFQSLLGPIVWSPLALLLTSVVAEHWGERGFGRQSFWVRAIPAVLVLALIFAAQFLSGYQQTFINSLIICAVYLVAVCLARRDGKGLLVCIGAFGFAGILALGLSMLQFLLTWELIPLSIRSAEVDPGLDLASLHPRLFLSWLLPFFAGRPGYSGEWWGEPRLSICEFWVGTSYVGILPLGLAVFALGRLLGKLNNYDRKNRFYVLFLLSLVVFGILMAMGKYTPLFMWSFRHVPLFDKMRWPSKYLQLVSFALPLLGGFGLQAFLASGGVQKRHWQNIFLMLGWGFFIAMATAMFFPRLQCDLFSLLTGGAYVFDPARPDNQAGLMADWKNAVLFVGGGIALLSLLVCERILPRWKYCTVFLAPILVFINLFVVCRQIHPLGTDSVYRSHPQSILQQMANKEPTRTFSLLESHKQRFLYGISDPNVFYLARAFCLGESSLPDHLFKIGGGETLKLESYFKFVEFFWKQPRESSTWQRMATLLNIGWVVQEPSWESIITASASTQVQLSEYNLGLPRALVMEEWSVQPNAQASLARLFAADFDPYHAVILDALPAPNWPREQGMKRTAPQPIHRLAEGGVDRITYGWNRVDLTVRSSGQAVLLLNDANYPGWKVWVNGCEMPIVRGNALFRAVALQTAGRHEVVFQYKPWQVPAGMASAGVTVVFMICLAFWAWRKRQSHPGMGTMKEPAPDRKD